MKVHLIGTVVVRMHIDRKVTISDDEAPNNELELFELAMQQIDFDDLSDVGMWDDEMVAMDIIVPKKS